MLEQAHSVQRPGYTTSLEEVETDAPRLALGEIHLQPRIADYKLLPTKEVVFKAAPLAYVVMLEQEIMEAL